MTISKAQYDQIMLTRTRPLTDPHMNVNKSDRARLEATTTTDGTINMIETMIDNRTRRGTANRPIPTDTRRPTRTICGTVAGYTRHRRLGETCAECETAHKYWKPT